MPLDPKPEDAGNVVLGDGNLCFVLSKVQRLEALKEGKTIYRAHWSTCPDADLHRT